MLTSSGMARRFDRDKEDVLSEQDLKQLRENLSWLSPQGVRDFYDRAHEECGLIYTRLATPRKIQTLVPGLEAVVEVEVSVGPGAKAHTISESLRGTEGAALPRLCTRSWMKAG